ncbi:MAG: hypothetical protein ACOC85_02780 [Thermoplasmatota archaeon]
MPVKSFEIFSIDAERFSEKSQTRKNIRIDHNSSVTKIKQLDKDSSEISFRFTATYSGMGRIELEGRLKHIDGPSDLASRWQKENKMPNEVANEVHSAIISNCIPQSVLVSREIQLPPPIPLPKVNIPDQKKNKKEFKGGMEVA